MIALCCTLLLMLSCTAALAEVPLADMTDDDLITLINAAMLELSSRAAAVGQPAVIFDADGVYIAFTESAMSSTGETIALNFILKNLTAYNMKLSIRKAEVNGWVIQRTSFWLNSNGNRVHTIDPGSSYRYLHFSLSDIDDDAGVTQASDVKTIVFTIDLDDCLSDGTRQKHTVIVSCIATEDKTLKITSIEQTD